MESLSPFFVGFRLLYLGLSLLGVWLLWRRPSPALALGLVLGLNLLAWAAYVWPLGRLYGLEEHLDQGFLVGMAACVAAGNSPFDHTQVGFGNLEPFWTGLVGALAWGHPERVMSVYFWLAPVALVLVTLGLYLGLRPTAAAEDDRWERVLLVVAVLGLASFSLSQRTPIPPLWTANFLLKPNHAISWALVAVILGARLRGASWLRLGLLLGLLAWVFLLSWVYLLLGLGVWLLWQRAPRRDWVTLVGAGALSLLIALPDIANLAREHSPTAKGATPEQIWLDPLGMRLRVPDWATTDLGPLLVLGVLGALVLRRRDSPRDRLQVALLAGTWGLWLVYELVSPFGVAPEADELHYFQRLVTALAAGSALAWAGRHIESQYALTSGRGHVLVLAACLPLTFPAGFDPPTMDRYYRWCMPPIANRVLEYGAWVRENTSPQAVFLAGRSPAAWIPALAGRRVLLTDDSRPPSDYALRKQAERELLTSHDPAAVRATAARWGIEYLAIDAALVEEYGAVTLHGLGKRGIWQPVFHNPAVRILRLRGSDERRQGGEVPDLADIEEERLEQ